MKYNKEHYVGKAIQLFPGDTYRKFGVIKNVDDLGWIVEITESKCDHYKAGQEYFISHSYEFKFAFV